MKQVNIFFAVLVLTLMAFAPAAARADDDMDDLEVTLEVLDDVQDLDDAIAEMAGPDDDDVTDEDWERSGNAEDEPDDEGEPEDEPEDEEEFEDEMEDDFEDEFEHDDEASEDEMEDEDDFEDDEDIDEDAIDDDDEEDDGAGDDPPVQADDR